MQIKKDRGIRWTSNEGYKIVGILQSTSKTHYEIDVPSLGVISLDRSDGVFEPASKAEVAEYAAEAEQKQEQEAEDTAENAQPKPENTKKASTGSNRTYTVAGFSTLNGTRKLRVANSLSQRVARLQQCGHTDIQLFELPEAMTRKQAAEWLSEQGVD